MNSNQNHVYQFIPKNPEVFDSIWHEFDDVESFSDEILLMLAKSIDDAIAKIVSVCNKYGIAINNYIIGLKY